MDWLFISKLISHKRTKFTQEIVGSNKKRGQIILIFFLLDIAYNRPKAKMYKKRLLHLITFALNNKKYG